MVSTYPTRIAKADTVTTASVFQGSGSSRSTRRRAVVVTDAGSVELERGVPHELLPLVRGLDLADRARLRAHHERLRARAVAPVAHALQQVAVADAAGAEEDVVAGHEVVGGERLVEVVAQIGRAHV